jgi:hypothetical protein
MQNYLLRVVSSSRRWMLVTGLSLISLVFLFPTKPVKMQGSSATPDQTPVLGGLTFSYTQIFLGVRPSWVYLIKRDGSGTTLLAPIGAQLAWSPDGSKLAMAGQEAASHDIYVVNADGTNLTRLTSTPDDEKNPSWSVTGKIAYERNNQIWTMNPDGTNPAPFSAITQPAPTAPAWSPDGSKLAFASGGFIWVINANGTDERRITGEYYLPANYPSWSSDGSKIAFSRNGTSQDNGIYVMNADGTNETHLSPGGFTDIRPEWSSDNTQIAFLRTSPFNHGIYVMNADGSNSRPVAGNSEEWDLAWQPVPLASRPRFDFDGDLRDDFAVYRPGATPTAQSYWDILRSGSNASLNVQFGSGEDKIVPADYNGDGKADIAVWRPSTGTWYTSQDPATSYGAVQWGISGDIPIPGDFDGDGKADHAVYRPSDGVWYILYSSDGSFVGRQFGTSTDKPLRMDYDGDHKTDLAYLRTVGTDYYWYILQSSTNTAVVPRLGLVGDKAVPGDYDGDGKSNLAVYRPDTGKWMILNAAGTASVEYQWGVSGDVPAPGDFDADGLMDLAVFRPDTAVWYVARSGGSVITQPWGIGTDLPVEAAYIP